MGLFTSKHRTIFVDDRSTVLADMNINIRRRPIPHVGECVVLGEKSYRVYNVIHSMDDDLTWVACNLVFEEKE